jgi:hypothetical protein
MSIRVFVAVVTVVVVVVGVFFLLSFGNSLSHRIEKKINT